MAYFPHAWQKVLLGTNAVTPFKDGSATEAGNYLNGYQTVGNVSSANDVLAGQIFISHGITNQVVDLNDTPTYAKIPMFYVGQGSLHTVDKLGPFHGGYQETVRSKGINPKYVSKFWVTEPVQAINQIVQVAASGCELECNKTYYLRVDVKGAPSLRHLTHNAYYTAAGFTGCCNIDEDPVDPNVVFLQWMDLINRSPLMNPFILASVWNDVTALSPVTMSVATSDGTITGTTTPLAAGQRVVFTPSVTSGASAWSISGKTLTLNTMISTSVFSVGQTIADANGLLPANVKIEKLLTGDGGAGSTFLINLHVALTSTAGGNLTSSDPLTCYVATSYVSGATVPLVCATYINTPSTTALDTAFASTAVAAQFFASITTAGYTPATSSVDDIVSFVELVGAYVDTVFGNCSFFPTDHYEIEPVRIYASITDQVGDPCDVSCFTVSEAQEAFQGKGYGETYIREYILSNRYRQEPYVYDPRLREVLDETAFLGVDRTLKYYSYNILHSVPRKSNPTGMMDNDQYLVKIVTTSRTGNAALFETWMNTLLADAGNNVQLEFLP